MKYLRLWLSSQGFPFRGLWEKSRASSPPASAPKPCKYTLWFAFSPFPPLVLTLHVSELHKILSDPICSPDLNTNLLSLSKLKRMCCRSPQWKVPLQYTECACSHVCRTVLLMNPSEVPAEFLSVAKQLTCLQHSQKDTYITLIKHAFQSTLGTKYPLHHIHTALQVSTENKVMHFAKPETYALSCMWWWGHPWHFPQSQILSWNVCQMFLLCYRHTDKRNQFSCSLLIRQNRKVIFLYSGCVAKGRHVAETSYSEMTEQYTRSIVGKSWCLD